MKSSERKTGFLKPIKNNSIVDMVVSRLTGAIVEGELKPGDRIPTETELAEILGVGRNTIREAIRVLVSYGVLEIRRADGTYVCDGFSPKILDPMLYGIVLQKESAFKSLIGLRKLIDNGILQLLSEVQISEETWASIKAAQKEFEKWLNEEAADVKKIADSDIAFHYELAKATDNVAVFTTYHTIVEITKDFLYKNIEMIVEAGEQEQLIISHRQILEKLAKKDMKELYQTVDWSYSFWDKNC